MVLGDDDFGKLPRSNDSPFFCRKNYLVSTEVV